MTFPNCEELLRIPVILDLEWDHSDDSESASDSDCIDAVVSSKCLSDEEASVFSDICNEIENNNNLQLDDMLSDAVTDEDLLLFASMYQEDEQESTFPENPASRYFGHQREYR